MVTAATFGIDEEPPILSLEDARKAIDSGIIQYKDTTADIFEPYTGHIMIHPELIELPARVHEEISRIGALSIYTSFKPLLDVPLPFEEGLFLEYLQSGLLRNFLYASLFVMDLSSIVSMSKKHCVHAKEACLEEELASIVCTITGSIRNVFVLPGKRLLCIIMTRTPGDTELIASLVSKTALRLLSLTHAAHIKIGSYSSVKLSHEDLGSALLSFINEL